MKSTKDVYDGMTATAVRKSSLSLYAFIGLGFLAGLFISFGAISSSTMVGLVGPLNIGLAKALGSLAFALGLTATIVCGAELFTGNILMACGVWEKAITMKGLLKNWTLVYIINFMGALFLVLLIYYGHAAPEAALTVVADVAEAKTSSTIAELLWRGIGCNFLVCLGVWMAAAANDVSGKMLAATFPVFTFVFLGYEHCIANMFYLPLGYLVGADITMASIGYNLFWVTIGNILGGLLVAIPFILTCHTKNEAES